ncbi:uncharacterized protein LOC121732026 [Aricia agestis]|uniref:uncharacterized protein LOC121732026 n=1 Tax=Aricia agestis TaxID=91739 RepID=UPI001C20BB07|nr:uncharacterized protein LOC121732026 [Aricia agestis]
MNRATNRSCIFIVLLLLCVTQQITSKRTFGGGSRHSYPSSGGLSGSGGRHSYPSSGGLSGTGGSHGYPSGGSHGYPSSGGLSGTGHSRPSGNAYPSNTQSHGYPSNTQSHGYPSNTQSHGYPSSTGMSGNSRPSGGHTTNIHYHYNYNPPQQIRYAPVHGGAPINYPVYHGTPPTYVYKYQDSGSKYGTLLAGLALLNLGTLAGTAYALNRGHSNSYKPAPGEVCKFGLKKENGDYEETRIDCEIISSFIYTEQAKANNVSNTNTVVTTTVTNVTTINSPHNETAPAAAGPVVYEMYPNGTLVPRNETTNNTATAANNTDNTMASSVTVTTTNTTTVTNALDVKGKPVDVTPGMQCYVIRHTPSSHMKKTVPCGLLQTYATTSLKKNSASRNVPIFTILTVVLSIFVAN